MNGLRRDRAVRHPTIDELIDRRNEILLESGDSDECWQRLGIANRHIERVVDGVLSMTPGVIKEIESCFERTIKEMSSDGAEAMIRNEE